ncbi:MAG: RidA family protein [Muricauda sp. TMED12]|nr:MAG: RidA family protein [Muricauda sp. TMED12]
MYRNTIQYLVALVVFVAIGCNKGKNSEDGTRAVSEQQQVDLRQKWHWDNNKGQSDAAGYAQVVKVGPTIYVSGVPTSDLSPVGVAQLYGTLRACLESFGATPQDVVKETLYTTDIEAMKLLNDHRKEFYEGDFPAASWVEVSRLYEPTAKLEVDLVAYLPATGERK